MTSIERMTFVEAAPIEKLGQTSRMSRFIGLKTICRIQTRRGMKNKFRK